MREASFGVVPDARQTALSVQWASDSRLRFRSHRFSPCFGSTMVDTGPEPLTDAFRANFSHKFSREFCMRIARKVAPVNHGRQGSQRPSFVKSGVLFQMPGIAKPRKTRGFRTLFTTKRSIGLALNPPFAIQTEDASLVVAVVGLDCQCIPGRVA